jgi:hypothetical protein
MCYKGRAEGFHFRKEDYGNVATYSKFRTVGCRGLYNRNISARHYIAFSVSSAINHRKSCTQHQRKPVDKGTEKVINEWPTLGRKIDIKSGTHLPQIGHCGFWNNDQSVKNSMKHLILFSALEVQNLFTSWQPLMHFLHIIAFVATWCYLCEGTLWKNS